MEFADIEQNHDFMALGIKFSKHHSIFDNIGSITDTLLYSEDSEFDSSFFPKIIRDIYGSTLIDYNKDHKLVINPSNVIFEYSFSEEECLKDIDKYIKNYKEMIVDGIFKKYSISKILRIGFLNRYKINDSSILQKFTEDTIGITKENINEISLRFSKRYTVEKALIQKGTDDYCNVIYTIDNKADSDDLFITVDYQLFYLPYIPDSSYINFDNFIKSAIKYNNKNFVEWLNNYEEP